MPAETRISNPTHVPVDVVGFSVASNPQPMVPITHPMMAGGAKRPFFDTKMPAISENSAFAHMYGIMFTPLLIAEEPLMAWNQMGR